MIDHPRLAHLYTYVLRDQTVTIDQIVADLELPRTTAYADVGTLVDLGVLTRDDSQKTHTYTATPIRLTATLDGAAYTITPTLIEAIGRLPHDQDLDLQPAFGSAVLQALRDVILAMQDHDPYLEELHTARDRPAGKTERLGTDE